MRDLKILKKNYFHLIKKNFWNYFKIEFCLSDTRPTLCVNLELKLSFAAKLLSDLIAKLKNLQNVP